MLSDFKKFVVDQKTGKGTSMLTLKRYLKHEEKRYLKTLLESGKTRKELASLLEITEQALSKKIKEYKLKT